MPRSYLYRPTIVAVAILGFAAIRSASAQQNILDSFTFHSNAQCSSSATRPSMPPFSQPGWALSGSEYTCQVGRDAVTGAFRSARKWECTAGATLSEHIYNAPTCASAAQVSSNTATVNTCHETGLPGLWMRWNGICPVVVPSFDFSPTCAAGTGGLALRDSSASICGSDGRDILATLDSLVTAVEYLLTKV